MEGIVEEVIREFNREYDRERFEKGMQEIKQLTESEQKELAELFLTVNYQDQ